MLNFLRKVFYVTQTEEYCREWLRNQAALIPAGSMVLDAGAGQCQYKSFFKNHEYVALDLCVGDDQWDFSHIDIKAPLHDIPVVDATFDHIVCTQVLEHVPNPIEVMRELGRVCKPGGTLLLAVPFSAREHQIPHDFYRYTRFGLEYLLAEGQWNVERIDPVRGDMYRLYCVLSETGYHFKGSHRRKLAQFPLMVFKAFLAATLSYYEKFEVDDHGTGAWHVIGRRRT